LPSCEEKPVVALCHRAISKREGGAISGAFCCVCDPPIGEPVRIREKIDRCSCGGSERIASVNERVCEIAIVEQRQGRMPHCVEADRHPRVGELLYLRRLHHARRRTRRELLHPAICAALSRELSDSTRCARKPATRCIKTIFVNGLLQLRPPVRAEPMQRSS
jgi:hypothetical protein